MLEKLNAKTKQWPSYVKRDDFGKQNVSRGRGHWSGQIGLVQVQQSCDPRVVKRPEMRGGHRLRGTGMGEGEGEGGEGEEREGKRRECERKRLGHCGKGGTE